MSTRNEFSEQIKARTKRFTIDVLRMSRNMPNHTDFHIIKSQLIRSASSVGANSRAVARAMSDKAMYSKLKIVEEEADESVFWIEVIDELLLPQEREAFDLSTILKEAKELTAIFSASVRTVRKRLNRD